MRSLRSLHGAAQARLHHLVPDLGLVLVGEALGLGDRLLHGTARSSGSRCWSALRRRLPTPRREAARGTSPRMRAAPCCLRLSWPRIRRDQLRVTRFVERPVLVGAGAPAGGTRGGRPRCPRSATTRRCGIPSSSASANFTPGRGVAVVVQHLDAGRGQFGVEALCLVRGRDPTWRHVQRYQHHLEGRERRRPDDAGGVVVLLDRGGDDARDAYAVAAHGHQHRLAPPPPPPPPIRPARWPSSIRCSLVPSWKMCPTSMPRRIERRPGPVGLGSPGTTLRRSTPAAGSGEVAAPVDAGEVQRPSRWRRRRSRRARAPHGRRTAGISAQRARGSRVRRRVAARIASGRRHPQRARDAGQLLRLDGIQLVIAAQRERDHAAFESPSTISSLSSRAGSSFEEGRDIGDGALRRASADARASGCVAAARVRGRRQRRRRARCSPRTGPAPSETAMASSPESASTWNSSEALPPMAPVSALHHAELEAHARRTCARRRRASRRSPARSDAVSTWKE